MKIKGYLCGISAAVTWGTVFFVGRIVMGDGSVNPLVLAFWRCFFASLFLFVLLGKRVRDLIHIVKRDWIILFFLALTGIFMMNMLVFSSLRYTTATSSSILMNANPLFILILATLFLREKITSDKILAVLLGFLGCAIVIKGTSGMSVVEGSNFLKGNFMAIGAALCWSLYTVIGKEPTNRYGAVLTTFITLSLGMLFFLFAMLIQEINFWDMKPGVFLAGVYLGIIPAGIGFTLWYNALKYLEAGILGIFQYIASVVTAVMAILFLKETIDVIIIAGMLLVFLSLYIPRYRAKT